MSPIATGPRSGAQLEAVRRQNFAEAAEPATGSLWFRYHFDRVAGALVEADGAAGAEVEIDGIFAALAELHDRLLGAGREAVVALEAVAAGEAAVGLGAPSPRADSPHH